MSRFKLWVKGEESLFTLEDSNFDTASQPLCRPVFKPGKISASLLIKGLNIISLFCLTVFLLITALSMPRFGSGSATENLVTERYIEKGIEEVGGTNLVSNMIMIYRGFDTFGESAVLFATAVCVIMLMERPGSDSGQDILWDMKYEAYENSMTLKRSALVIILFVAVFSLYIMLNGHLSPGGGFSGGTVLGTALILIDITSGSKGVSDFFNHRIYNLTKVGALCAYAFILLLIILPASNGVAGHIRTGTPGAILSAGPIPLLNVLVGLEVACTMYAFYTYFGRGRL